MHYMFKNGFMPFGAPLFMDEIVVIIALLPFLIVFAISQAKKKKISFHIKLQTFLYLIGMLVILYFEYGARAIGGFNRFLEKSAINHTFLYIFLVSHIIIAITTIFLWSYTIYFGLRYHNKLPQKEFKFRHIKMALKAFFGITLTSVTGVLLYIFMFVLSK